MHPLLDGFLLALSIFIALGPQDLLIIRQGASGQYIVRTTATCIACDIFLVMVGIMGIGSFFATNALLRQATFITGLGFILFYAILSIKRTIKPQTQTLQTNRPPILAAIALSILNPYAFIDIAVVLGGVSAQYPSRAPFAAGACLASLIWFSLLAYTATLLRPILNHPATSRILDGTTAAIMLFVATRLALHEWMH